MIEPDLVIRFDEKVTIPEGCKGCPALNELAAHHDRHARRTAHMADLVVSGRAEAGLEGILGAMGVSPDRIEEVMDRNKDEFRSMNNGTIDRMYGHLDSAVEIGEAMIGECPSEGKLTLRARRSGQQVLVTLCMSRYMMVAAETTNILDEPVVVRRTDIADEQ